MESRAVALDSRLRGNDEEGSGSRPTGIINLPGKALQILVSNFKRQTDIDVSRAAREILAHLSRHGVGAREGGSVMDEEIEAGEALLSSAADCGADPMIARALIRSRVRELTCGSSVRTLIRAMTVPLLFSI